jgi:hypothetical protein
LPEDWSDVEMVNAGLFASMLRPVARS